MSMKPQLLAFDVPFVMGMKLYLYDGEKILERQTDPEQHEVVWLEEQWVICRKEGSGLSLSRYAASPRDAALQEVFRLERKLAGYQSDHNTMVVNVMEGLSDFLLNQVRQSLASDGRPSDGDQVD